MELDTGHNANDFNADNFIRYDVSSHLGSTVGSTVESLNTILIDYLHIKQEYDKRIINILSTMDYNLLVDILEDVSKYKHNDWNYYYRPDNNISVEDNHINSIKDLLIQLDDNSFEYIKRKVHKYRMIN